MIEGKYGFLNVFCSDADLSKLTAGLGEVWQTLTIAHKRYAGHGTAHVPMTAALALKAEHRIAGEDIASIVVAGNEKIVSHHDIKEPQEIGMAQYSVPFCMAVAFFRDPLDPNVFSEESVNDPAIRALTRNVTVEVLKDAPKGPGQGEPRHGEAQERPRAGEGDAQLSGHARRAADHRGAAEEVRHAHRRAAAGAGGQDLHAVPRAGGGGEPAGQCSSKTPRSPRSDAPAKQVFRAREPV